MTTHRRIAGVDAVPADSTYLFTLREDDSDEEREAILVRSDGGLHAWLNYCQHYTHINIDKGSGAEMRSGELICTNHGAYFESDSGYCNHGPCKGAYLNEIEISVDDGAVYLTDENYEYVGEGPVETDEAERGSESNYKF